jgi:hypothetical protein
LVAEVLGEKGEAASGFPHITLGLVVWGSSRFVERGISVIGEG